MGFGGGASIEEGTQFVLEHKLSFLNLYDESRDTWAQLGVSAQPAWLLFDTEGVLLDANENAYGATVRCPGDREGYWAEEAPPAADAELNRYPSPYQWELKELLADLRGVRKEQLFVGVEYRYWHNAIGIEDLSERSIEPMLQLNF